MTTPLVIECSRNLFCAVVGRVTLPATSNLEELATEIEALTTNTERYCLLAGEDESAEARADREWSLHLEIGGKRHSLRWADVEIPY